MAVARERDPALREQLRRAESVTLSLGSDSMFSLEEMGGDIDIGKRSFLASRKLYRARLYRICCTHYNRYSIADHSIGVICILFVLDFHFVYMYVGFQYCSISRPA